MPSNDELLDAISSVLPPILNALDVLAQVGRHLHPPNLGEVNDAVSGHVEAVRDASCGRPGLRCRVQPS